MKAGTIKDHTHKLLPPDDWDTKTQGVCTELEVVYRDGQTLSCWHPGPAELDAINSGAPIWLSIMTGAPTQPPVGLGVIDHNGEWVHDVPAPELLATEIETSSDIIDTPELVQTNERTNSETSRS